MSPIDLERIRSWLAAKFIERQEHHRIRRVYTADGGREPTPQECVFASIPVELLHEHLLSIGADLTRTLAECENAGWIYLASLHQPGMTARRYNISSTVMSPPPSVAVGAADTDGANTQGGAGGVEGADAGNGQRGASPAEGSPSQAELLEQLRPADRKAYLAWHFAESNVEGEAGKQLKEKPAYDFLREEQPFEDAGAPRELIGYRLPAFLTWTRQVRTARNTLGEQKHKRRSRRPTGRSIVRQEEIEQPQGDD